MNLDFLNPQQKKAVITTDRPLLVLAGAGSGKTSVITQKIAYLIHECFLPAQSIFAVTFTNKAAKEMKERVVSVLKEIDGDGSTAKKVKVSTFHQLGMRIIRSELERLGLSRDKIVVDPGIGFGKTEDHNLTLLRNLSLFHGLGCPILLGVSRKGFIGAIGKEPRKTARAPGSIAVALAGLSQGVQIIRVHDVAETSQALRLWAAVR